MAQTEKAGDALDRRVWVLLAGINKADKPCRYKVGEADRLEHKLRIGELCIIGQLGSVDLVLLCLRQCQRQNDGILA